MIICLVGVDSEGPLSSSIEPACEVPEDNLQIPTQGAESVLLEPEPIIRVLLLLGHHRHEFSQ